MNTKKEELLECTITPPCGSYILIGTHQLDYNEWLNHLQDHHISEYLLWNQIAFQDRRWPQEAIQNKLLQLASLPSSPESDDLPMDTS